MKNILVLLIAGLLVISSIAFGVTVLNGASVATAETGGIRVVKFNDLNMNEWWDRENEEALEGWTMKLYYKNGGQWLEMPRYETETDEYGEVYWDDLSPGTYKVEEVMQEHWMSTTGETKKLEVVADQWACHSFGNVQTGSICAWKFHDKNMDGEWTPPCEGIPDWEIEVWRDEKLWYSGETDEEGKVCFHDVPIGDYTVVEETHEDWMNVTPTEVDITVEHGETSTVEFGNVEYGYIKAYKFYDEDMNGEWDREEKPIEGWEIILYDETGTEELDRKYTNEGGCVRFDKLLPGTYVVREEERDGWFNTTETEVSLKVNAGQRRRVNFGNAEEYCGLRVYKYHDENNNGEYDSEEELLEDWTFNLWNTTDGEPNSIIATNVTGEEGYTMFWDLEPGYYAVQEVEQEPWCPTTDVIQYIEIVEGETSELWFGNVMPGDVYGMKYKDVYADGEFDVGLDEPLKDWKINLWSSVDGEPGDILMTTYTDRCGMYYFEDVCPGWYFVQEEIPDGWYNVTPDLRHIYVGPEEEVRVDFANCMYKHIYGVKFYDYNMNGVYDEGTDWVLPDWEIQLYNETGRELLDVTYTEECGYYWFEGLEVGTYVVREVVPDGWFNTTPMEYEVEIHCSSPCAPINFGNVEGTYGNIRVCKFYDWNMNGEYDDGEDMLDGWKFNLWNTTEGEPDTIINENVTCEDGCTMFWDLEPGLYAVQEVGEECWFPTTDMIQYIEVIPGKTVELCFGNVEGGRLWGYKYCDANMNQEFDDDECGIEGVTINLWSVNKTTCEPGEILRTTETNENGCYNFSCLEPGKYYVQEVVPDEWYNSTPALMKVEIKPGRGRYVDFGNYQLSNISGMKFYDSNQDGEYNEKDFPLEDWMINLWSSNESTGLPEEVIQTSYTDQEGYYYFHGIKPGYYWIQEEVPDGWYNTTANLVQVKAGCENTDIIVHFGNYRKDEMCEGRIYGYKFYDTNQNGEFDGDDWYMDGWEINLWNTTDGYPDEIIRTAYTDENGNFSFKDLEEGHYYVEEVLPLGWTNTTSLGVYVELESDQEAEVLFGNWAPIVCGPEGHTRGFWGHNICGRDGPGGVGYQVPYDDVVMYLQNISDRYGDDYDFLADLDMQKACDVLSYGGPDMKQTAEVQILALLLTAELYDYYDEEPMVNVPGVHHNYFVGTTEDTISMIFDHYDVGTDEGYEAAKDMADWLNNIDAGETYNEMFEGCYILELNDE
ncbi:MAG: SdrD B-like domain-containing protein [Candidatus Natronoplasma sp.]